MMSSKKPPTLPTWIFLLTDAALLLAAWFIAYRSPGALSANAIYGIVACVIVGAIVGTVPLLLRYERIKNETLDDRQRALEALASTLTTAADQISIAAQGLHAIAELAQKNLKMAEQLPQGMQEKIGELTSQVTGLQDEERAEMKKELAALRAIDGERLAAAADKVQKTAAELAKIDASAQKALAAVQAALTKAPETIAAATASAVAEIESRLNARTASVIAALDATDARRARKKAEPASPPAAEVDAAANPLPPPETTGGSKSVFPDVGTQIQPIVPPTSAPFAGHIVSLSPAPEVPPANPEPDAKPITADGPPNAVDPSPPAADSPVAAGAPVAADEPKPAKKRAPRKPKPAEIAETAMDLGITDAAPAPAAVQVEAASSEESPGTPAEPAISSDGATRLLVTAYIGIGNRLFIRGDGPGLNWEKGVPLQFVSIGKWRWESADAATAVKFKLYKNDETECLALGPQTLESGRQLEVTATF